MRGTSEPKWENVWPQSSIAEQANDVGHSSQRGVCGSKTSTTVRQSLSFRETEQGLSKLPLPGRTSLK